MFQVKGIFFHKIRDLTTRGARSNANFCTMDGGEAGAAKEAGHPVQDGS